MALPISMAMIGVTEAAMGVEFPAVFKMHMSRLNGGQLTLGDESWLLFPFFDTTNKRTIRRTAEDIKRETATAIDSGLGFPPDGIAIAHNEAGDLLFLKHDGRRVGEQVFMFRMHGPEIDLVLETVAELWERG